jgi:transcriptional regulator with XRE-family HTH domain
MSKNEKHLGWLISVARRERGLTQAELAKKLGTVQPSIARAERKGCTLSFAERVADVLGFEITNIALRAKDPTAKGLQFCE